MEIHDIIALIAAAGWVTTLITLAVTRRNRKADAKKAESDATEIIGKAWKSLLDELQEKANKQEARITALECALVDKDTVIASQSVRIKELEDEVSTLRKQVDNLRARRKGV